MKYIYNKRIAGYIIFNRKKKLKKKLHTYTKKISTRTNNPGALLNSIWISRFSLKCLVKFIISRALGYARAGWVICPPIFGRTKQIENNCLLDFLSLLFVHLQRSVSSIGNIDNFHSHM